MARKSNLRYTDEMRSYIWDRYKAGDSVWSIDRSIDPRHLFTDICHIRVALSLQRERDPIGTYPWVNGRNYPEGW